MEKLINKFDLKLKTTDTRFVRSIVNEINWNSRLIGIKGSRGVGKTTFLLQYIKLKLEDPLKTALYISLDDIYFAENKLSDLVSSFYMRGGRFLFIDEVHKYNNWAIELKNIYDDYSDLKIVFTGSSLLEILNSRADLSRRAIIYNMQGLSFREFLSLVSEKTIDKISLDEIIKYHTELASDISSMIQPYKWFSAYLKSGYFPFFMEEADLYHQRLEEIVNMIIEIELPLLRNVSTAYLAKVKQLLSIIAGSAPFIPNILKISQRVGVNRETILSYLHYLSETHLTFSVYKEAKGISLLQKPDKIYLENTNLFYALNPENLNIGNLRETFFANQLRNGNLVELSSVSDFLIDGKYTFEIGGKNKKQKQIANLENAFIAKDDIEIGFGNVIPLWLFGFLY